MELEFHLAQLYLCTKRPKNLVEYFCSAPFVAILSYVKKNCGLFCFAPFVAILSLCTICMYVIILTGSVSSNTPSLAIYIHNIQLALA